ncbi:MAG: class I SAM-dependent methyltransferase [Geminicoccaceae bacterium]
MRDWPIAVGGRESFRYDDDMQPVSKRHEEALAYLDDSHRDGGIGKWRRLYTKLLKQPSLAGLDSIVELGAGAPDFLAGLSMSSRLAVDLGERYRPLYEQAGISFRQADLEQDRLDDVGRFDVAVCSDVFEHLLFPHLVLENIRSLLTPKGVLLSHVPNEYALKATLAIMAGRREGLYYHQHSNEWEDPHVRRFTDLGYQRFLKLQFRHSIRLTQLGYKGLPKLMARFGVGVPYCLEHGPTYASTNDDETARQLQQAVDGLAKKR